MSATKSKLATCMFVMLLIAFPGFVGATEPDFNGNRKFPSMEAKPGQDRACFYLTIGALPAERNPAYAAWIYFRRVDIPDRFATASYYFLNFKTGSDYKLEDEWGKVVDFCVPPGRYELSGLTYMAGEMNASFAAQPDRFARPGFDAVAGESVYLGNLLMHVQGSKRCNFYECTPKMELNDRRDRDFPIIQAEAKNKPASPLVAKLLDVSGNAYMTAGKPPAPAATVPISETSPAEPPQ